MARIRNKPNRREELLKVTREIFAEKGYQATTVSEIVARAGIAQGTFYWYFPSKVSLVVTLAHDMQEQIETGILTAHATYLQTHDLGEMIDESVTAAFESMSNYRDVLSIILSDVHWSESPAERERIFTPYYVLIAELIRQEQKRCIISANIDADITAILIVGTIYHTAGECYIYNTSRSPKAYITEASRFIRRSLGIS